MYSGKIKKVLERENIKIGDHIRIKKGKMNYEGLLMPKTETGTPNSIVIKLSNGYNIGILYNKNTGIKKIKRRGKIKKAIPKENFDPSKAPISLISTGGTVASRIDYITGGVTGMMDPREFLHNVPELKELVNIKSILRPFTKMSEDMDYKDWQVLAKECEKELNKDIKGLIITHGTDFLHYTSSALSFMLKNLGKPVVLTGAQRSSDRGSSDAGFNLLCSAHVAISDIAEVGICMHGTPNDDFCLFNRGTKVRKMHSSRRDAFRPINDLPIAKVFPEGKFEITNSYKKREESRVKADTKFDPRVALLKVYPGSDPEIFDFYLDRNYKGFIIEASALGHVPTKNERSWIPKIEKAIKDGIFVGTTTQCLYGRVNPNVYTNLRVLYHKAGAIPLEDMLSETAYIKLGHVLGHTKDFEEIKKEMLTNYAGEISKKSILESFLY